ncbi:unnamed protein product [Fusarium graminearum]|nr:unnamed protein product [Fusarium graminearum]
MTKRTASKFIKAYKTLWPDAVTPSTEDIITPDVATEDIESVFLKVSRSLDAQLTRTLLRRLENTVAVTTTDTIRRNRNYLEKDVQIMKNMLQALTVHANTVAPASDDNGNRPDSSMDTETDDPGSRSDPKITSSDDEIDSEPPKF